MLTLTLKRIKIILVAVLTLLVELVSGKSAATAPVVHPVTEVPQVKVQIKEEIKPIDPPKIEQVAEKQEVTPPPPAPVKTVSYSGDKYSWMAQAGIPQDQWTYVDYIVSRESGWNPCAYNPGYSNCDPNFRPATACGLAQFLPCSVEKAGPVWQDPVDALRRQYAYVTARYGGYVQAYNYWLVHHNY